LRNEYNKIDFGNHREPTGIVKKYAEKKAVYAGFYAKPPFLFYLVKFHTISQNQLFVKAFFYE